MFTVIRHYRGATGLAKELKSRSADVQATIAAVPGFIAYYLIETADGAASVTVCESKAGCDETSTRAANYLREKLPNLKIAPPEVTAGTLEFKFANYPAKV